MKQFFGVVMLIMACFAVGAQNFGVGLDLSTDVYNVYVEKPEPQPDTMNKIADSSLLLRGYYFTPGILEFNAGLGFRLRNQEDPSDIDGDSIEEIIQFSILAALGTNVHFIKGEFLEAGLGGQIKATLNLQPDGADATEYIGAFTSLYEITFPVFLDIKFSDHLITRLSADMIAISIEQQRYEPVPGDKYNVNDLGIYSGIKQYGIVFSFIYRI